MNETTEFSRADLTEVSVHSLPGTGVAAIFVPSSVSIFREQDRISPLVVGPRTEIIPWGADNQMPYDIIDKIEADETFNTCMKTVTEMLYGAGLRYKCNGHTRPATVDDVKEFTRRNDLAACFGGAALDFKYFGFAVTVIILSADRRKVVNIVRKHACYCRFAPADAQGRIREVCFANWRTGAPYDESAIEHIPLLDDVDPLGDLRARIEAGEPGCKFAVVSRIPAVDSTYYPIPHYGSLFRSHWYDIKRLIGVAKEAKLRNSAPIKYQIEIADKYWTNSFKAQGLTDPKKRREFMDAEKERMIEFLTNAENSGKVLFSSYYVTPDGKECHDVVIRKVDTATQGGDWSTDIQEAVNMICFTMGVHSNLVGSVPGKSQSNNSGSDKRELYTLAQASQQFYRDLLMKVHRLVIDFNGWTGVSPECPFVKLTTLDEHTDAKEVSVDDETD